MQTAIVVGNPKSRSRTYLAADIVIEQLTGKNADVSVDLVDYGTALLDWTDTGVAALVEQLQASDLVVFASPTYKSTYTGLLKLFLDRIAAGALNGVTAVPLMLGGHWGHSMAADLFLKPVLVELGATCPTRGLFLLESDYAASDTLAGWLEQSRSAIAACAGQLR